MSGIMGWLPGPPKTGDLSHGIDRDKPSVRVFGRDRRWHHIDCSVASAEIVARLESVTGMPIGSIPDIHSFIGRGR